ncbi:hypothetical protein ACFU90_20230 [Streptomyces noursei]|uniref:Uncharacterized protein n=1 Tax=Streptomyces noursei TaxID=1971 RepID=A0A059W589_STRNR|nr:hypothetical protein [Streptomyces noursei]AKA05171.1 hypothetical protein SAZ_24050 [Streptomyces noursei ZPM]AIA04975.1 hypothetical protein DC74_4495 [Streptomyces noursei]EPY92507.1 hypothetical protein K530_52890 [Streptomyces noursei CCRC 11814]EXU89057.1 hypothetical protein P354_24755 [Streptomyces noursei PD-1]MCZ0971798.1 hypothetical protein [Streptomyces noursei]
MAVISKTTVRIAAAVALAAIAGCAAATQDGPPKSTTEGRAAPGKAPAARPLRLIGDGSTAYTGAQPHQPRPARLKPGMRPPQFVVFSWDGAGEDGQKLFSHFRAVGKKYGATMTYFLSGVYMLPSDKAELYEPPGHTTGASAIGFNDVQGIKDTVAQMRGAWEDGNEIGTHFNGHFCGRNGVGRWTPEQWRSEIEQAVWFVRNWKSNSGLRNEPPLPFDYAKELVGGRAPCLEGQRNLIPAAKEMGFRYDASSAGGLQTWPHKTDGIWNFPLQQIPFPGRNFEALSMDYNFLANQSGSTHGDRAMHAIWGQEMRDGILDAFERAHRGNRAPLFVGDHFESWNGGTYMKAVEEAIKEICPRRGVRCVSFKQLSDWLDAQDPQVLAKLQDLPVGRAPEDGWGAYLSGTPEASAPAPAARITPVAE